MRIIAGIAALCLAFPVIGMAQASPAARAEIVRKLIAEEGAARIDMPLGGEGVLLSATGEINKDKLGKQIQKNGRSIMSGRVVKMTAIEFDDTRVTVELDGGGKDKNSWKGHVQVSAGGASTVPNNPSAAKAHGSKIVLTFTGKVPAGLTSDQLKDLLAPVLDFTRRSVAGGTAESLPSEFKEAILAKQARIGMDQDTVFLALGLPNRKSYEKVNGVDQETWLYEGIGLKKTFVVFEKNIVVKVTEY